MVPRHISILGVGLLGGSLGLAAKAAIRDCRIVGYGHRTETLEAARQLGAIDVGYTRIDDAVKEAELIVLCTPVGLFGDILHQLARLISPTTLITDVGSTKRSVVTIADRVLPDPGQFVASHPMAGSEKRGVQYATADLYRNALCILTPSARTNPSALESIGAFWRLLGMRICTMSPEEHDRRLAAVSHVPHLLAATLVAMQESPSLPLAGKGFLDMTRIAGGDGALWRDILIDNRDNVRRSVLDLQERLSAVLRMLDADDADAMRRWLDDAAATRAAMLEQRAKSSPS